MRTGFVPQSLQLPSKVRDQFRERAKRSFGSSVQAAGTVACLMLLALDDAEFERITRKVHELNESPDKIDTKLVQSLLSTSDRRKQKTNHAA